VGREFYSVTFYYDEATKAKLKYDYATCVRIWADNGEVYSIQIGEGMTAVFLDPSYERVKAERFMPGGSPLMRFRPLSDPSK
jgi:hypothetical protein